MRIWKMALVGLLAICGAAVTQAPASARPMVAPDLIKVAAVPEASGTTAAPTCHWRRGRWYRHRWGYRPYYRHHWHRWGYHPYYWHRPFYGYHRPYYRWHHPAFYRPYGWHHHHWHRYY